MAFGDKKEKKEKSCSCVKNEGRFPRCKVHGAQRYREA